MPGKHIGPTIVAVVCVVVALSDGGYSAEFCAGASLVLWWAVIIGLALGGWPRAPVPRVGIFAGACLAGLAGLTLLSVIWADDVGLVVREVVRVSGYLGLFVLVVIASPANGASHWLGGLTVGLLVVAALALGSRLQPELFPANTLASFLPNTRARLSYPLEYWNGLGALLALSIVALAGFGAAARSPVRRAISVASMPIPALGLFLTSSRGGVVAAAVGLTALVALGPARGRVAMGAALGVGGGLFLAALASSYGDALIDGRTTAAARIQGDELLLITLAVVAAVGALRYALDSAVQRHRLTRAARTLAVGLTAIVVVVAVVTSNPIARFDELTEPPAGAATPSRGFVTSHIASAQGTGRAQFWETALDAFASSPVSGIGAGGYEAYWARHGSLAYYVRDAHSLFLEQLAELGIAGLAAVIAFLVAGFSAGRRRHSKGDGGRAIGICLGLLACGLTSAALDWTWELPAAFGPVVLVVALLVGPATALPGHSQRTPGGYGWGVATLVVGWLALVAAGLALMGEVQIGISQEATRDGDLATAATAAENAARIQPWSSGPRLQEALVAERRGDTNGALSAVDEALDRAPEDWRLWLTAARLHAKAGNVPEARRALARARELNPRSPIFAGAQ